MIAHCTSRFVRRLALLFMLTPVASGLFMGCGRPNAADLADTATAEAVNLQVVQQQTGTALAEVKNQTATAVASAATAEVQRVAPTQTVVAAATAVAAIAENAALVFDDQFVDNRNFWKLGAAGEFETTDLVDGTFEVTWNGTMSSSEFYELVEFRNFLAEADCRVIQNVAAGSCAMTFAWQNEVGYYRFELFPDYYRLFLQLQDAEPQVLAEGKPETAYQADSYNRIRILREGPRIRVSVNAVQLVDVTDETLLIGKVGITTASYSVSEPVVIRFDSFVISTLGETP